MAELFSDRDLSDYLRKPVSLASALSVERVVWGWLSPALELTERPDPVPDAVFSWALELAAIAYENPSGLSSYQLGAEQFGFSAERRAEILAEAGGGRVTPGSPAAPLGSFPEAIGWPDPARYW